MRRQPAPGRSRVNDPDATRGRVLDAAAELFQLRGYNATSTHELVSKAGVTSGALHHHFRSKKDIGLAVLRERVAPAVKKTWIDPVQSSRTATEGILTAFDQVASSLARRKVVLGCPLNNLAIELSLLDPDFRQVVREIYDGWRESLAQRLSSEFEQIDAEAAATFVVASYSGAIALAKSEQDPSPLKACAQQLERTMRQWRRRSRRS